ncbi:DUF2835 domain-containing protein [Vibrio algarum]|uniref:DUF2835 domain-containing protein n=1 Tax=Vibrio algarum TaxID=3020714 RepID=A0ABT4YQS0_9VIBR|nr:DUF2835 domain-containing protein [Vibrio sp. KJ40-1]MDB1123909.1 DUF2835 domain-containing protein [Vibrio sp. KJ40-1]
MNQYTFRLDIPYHVFLQHYSGAASSVLVYTEQGLKLQVPAMRLRPFLTQIGVKGRFRLTTNELNKFVKLEAI